MISTTRRRMMLAAGAAALVAPRAAGAGEIILKIGDQKGGCQSVMQAAGVLKDFPFRIEWSQFPAAAPLLEALNAGAVDTAFASDSPSSFALAAGVPAKIIAAYRASGAGVGIVVPAGSRIQSVADLRGKRIGTNRGSIGNILVAAVIRKQGWPDGALTLANLLPADAKAALASGAIDAWSTWAPYLAQAELEGGAREVANGAGLLSGITVQTASYTAIAEKHPALLEFVRRHGLARRWARDHVDVFAREWAHEIGVSEQVAELSFHTESPLLVPLDTGVVQAIQGTADLLFSSGLLRARLDVTGVVDLSFASAVAA